MELSNLIDHTVLHASCTLDDIKNVCREAQEFHFAAVCIPPYYVKDAVRILAESSIKVATVVGFPLGYSATPAKVEEVKRAVDEGADEIDVVINICAVKNNNWSYVRNDIDSMTRAAHLKGRIIKVILEIDLLNEEEIIKLCEICNDIKVNFVKTSTGYHGKGVTPNMVRLLKENLNKEIKLKVSGGIHSRATAEALISAGADRIGSSRGIELLR